MKEKHILEEGTDSEEYSTDEEKRMK